MAVGHWSEIDVTWSSSKKGDLMVKIREVVEMSGPIWYVEMYHLGTDGYKRGLWPYDPVAGEMLPPWPPDFMPSEGHLLFVPSITPLSPETDTYRAFDYWRNTGEGETPALNEDSAWAFFYRMLGAPWTIISRCRYCFPYGHRYLTI
jgi:hypothetical protein